MNYNTYLQKMKSIGDKNINFYLLSFNYIVEIFLKFLLIMGLLLMSLFTSMAFAEKEQLLMYSSRAKHLISPFLKQYQQKTGIKVNLITDKAPVLRKRLSLEGKNSQADILMTVDSGNLWKAAEEGLFRSIESKVFDQNIPSHLKDRDNRWFALTVRARTIVYSPERVKITELSNYQGLSDSRWKNRLCLRTSKKVYNQSLVGMLIHHYGETKTLSIVKGWVKNLAHKPYAKDSLVIKAIANGECDAGLVNTYYYGRILKKNADFSKKVKLYWAGQKSLDTGVHINISGAGVLKNSKRPKQAQAFLEWLSSSKIQRKFAEVNLEYPVNLKVKDGSILKQWGTFNADKSDIYLAGKYQKKAVKLMDKAGYK